MAYPLSSSESSIGAASLMERMNSLLGSVFANLTLVVDLAGSIQGSNAAAIGPIAKLAYSSPMVAMSILATGRIGTCHSSSPTCTLVVCVIIAKKVGGCSPVAILLNLSMSNITEM
ncbi:hypothetical protein HPP92_027320 [Vanilla planifolia]|uniref:Uncharacterized protein n=1 Tax=Vanilla planifolia TaxID=51239 RepID=A0A835U7W5_VANPL|nr:hypothetical protein HPP92_027320 [Vanilla planifolia]